MNICARNSSIAFNQVNSFAVFLFIIMLLFPIGCSTQTKYVSASSRVSQRLDKLLVEVDMPEEIDFIGAKLHGNDFMIAAIGGLIGYSVVQGASYVF
ncbi:MAG: hypothetical protein PF904_01180 [Kiritimatiellae bacterium]|jgi:hypothetical protein|nr:hypothetical protein [Kiritimatiellia bacterium]